MNRVSRPTSFRNGRRRTDADHARRGAPVQRDGRPALDPETNVRLAAQVLSKIDAGLRFAPGTPDDDRMSIILAAYNGGIGHVNDARRLARSHGENPDSWETVARYLALKRCPNTTSSRRYAAAGSPRQPDEGLRPRRSETLRPLLPYRSTLRTRSRFRNRKQRGSLPRCFFIELPQPKFSTRRAEINGHLRCFGIAPKAAKDRAAERAEENPFAAHLQQQHGERRDDEPPA